MLAILSQRTACKTPPASSLHGFGSTAVHCPSLRRDIESRHEINSPRTGSMCLHILLKCGPHSVNSSDTLWPKGACCPACAVSRSLIKRVATEPRVGQHLCSHSSLPVSSPSTSAFTRPFSICSYSSSPAQHRTNKNQQQRHSHEEA